MFNEEESANGKLEKKREKKTEYIELIGPAIIN